MKSKPETANSVSVRKKEIVTAYLAELDKHMQELKAGATCRALEIREFAALVHVHPVHLSHTIKEVTGQSSCEIYEHRLLNLAKEMLLQTRLSIAQIARQLTYDPSNFTKFFKAYTGITPKKFRDTNTAGINS